MAKYAHRIAFNCDLFMTLHTESSDTTLEELEKLAIAALREPTGDDDTEISDLRFDVPFIDAEDVAIYPRVYAAGPAGECLENISIENVEEVANA